MLSRPGARIADIGCGGGWSSIALARAYPQATVAGYDIDEPSVRLATANVDAAGLADRVSFHADGATALVSEAVDAVFAFECIHDMADPVGTLREIRRAVKPDGVVVIMDEAVAERFAPGGDDIERLMYGFSLMICLPDGMSSKPTAATGTVMRRAPCSVTPGRPASRTSRCCPPASPAAGGSTGSSPELSPSIHSGHPKLVVASRNAPVP